MTQKTKFHFFILSLATLFATGCSKDYDDDYKFPPSPNSQPIVVKGAGDISGVIGQFRSLLGDSLNNSPGKTSGRREISWDGVPANITNGNNFPFDFFNSTDPAVGNGRKRGLVYSNTGTSFRVDSSAFVDIEPTYAAEFRAFSQKKLFTSIGNNVTEFTFRVPGTNTDAFVNGFGLVFSDVDNADATRVEFYNEKNKSLGIYKAPVRNDANGFSFLGVFFTNEKVTRVKITSGNGLLAAGNRDVSAGGAYDLVVMDDFFYDEPLTIQ